MPNLKGGSPVCFAGLWERWKSPEGETIESCTNLTTNSNRLVAPLNNRMLVIVLPRGYPPGLSWKMPEPEQLKPFHQHYLADLMDVPGFLYCQLAP